MDYLPVSLNIRHQRCLVVGGGEVAVRKAGLLLRAGAYLRVVAPDISDAMVRLLADNTHHQLHRREFMPSDLEHVVLVIAATDHRLVNEEVSQLARFHKIPVNVVDQPELCSFVLPSIVDRSPVTVAVSSGGSSPVLARTLRAKIETMVPASYGRLAKLVGSLREAAKNRFADPQQRRQFWEQVLDGPVAELVFAGREQEAQSLLEATLSAGDKPSPEKGEVYLIGAGPGDPDLLTFRALRLMQQADVVLYDRLVSEPILDLVRRDAERIYVGKARSNHAVPQEEINEMLVRLAQQGKRVCRLKGGDPFIFGRGGEEIERLKEEGIPFQVVPGITAASGCSAYSGIPLTHRDYSQSVRFVTAHLREGAVELPWFELAQERQTIVFYMGLNALDRICSELIKHGKAPETPVALIQQGTTPQQKVWTADLASITQKIASEEVHAPTLIIVGDVVRLQDKLSWFQPGQA